MGLNYDELLQSASMWTWALGAERAELERRYSRALLLTKVALIRSQFPEAKQLAFMKSESNLYVRFVWDEAGNDLTDTGHKYDDGGGYTATDTLEDEWSQFAVEFEPQPFDEVDLVIDIDKALTGIGAIPESPVDRLSTPGKTYDHEARLADSAEPGDRCRECGEDITWVGPSQYDYLHVDDVENR